MAAVNLRSLFGDRVFRIPDFQRGYAWEEKQLLELWDDINEIHKENDDFIKHYTGTIYYEEVKPGENEKWLSGITFNNIVDGQQRLTTIAILIFELLKLGENGYGGESKDDLIKTYVYKENVSKKSRIYKFSYSQGDNNYAFLLKNIFEDSSIILPQNSLNLYSKNLLFAKSFFSEKLSQLSEEDRELFFMKITSALVFDLRLLEKDLDVQAVFETMNNRGKPLSTLEKLKNRLIFLNEKLKSSPEDRKKLRDNINISWGKIYNALAQNPDYVLDEDEFLSAHLSLYRKPKEAVFSEKIAEEKVFQIFCNKSEKYLKDEGGEKEDRVSHDKIEDYIVKLSESAPIWYSIHNSTLLIIKKILLLNNSKELKVFLLALFTRSNGNSLTSSLLKVEKLLFRNRVLWLFDERAFANWGREYYVGESTLVEIENEFDELLNYPIPNQNLIQSMNHLYNYVNGNKGFHRWGTLKYFLFEYEEELKQRFLETSDKVSIADFGVTTIEHIVPRTYQTNWSNLVDEFTNDLEEEQKTLAQKVLLNTLGNLTILKDGKNSSLNNSGWEDKVARFKLGSHNEIDISLKGKWTHKEIYERGMDMVNFLEKKINNLSLSEDEKHKLLFYQDYIIDKFIS